MKTTQFKLKANADFEAVLAPIAQAQPDLILVFGGLSFFESPKLAETIKKLAPNAALAGCSTAGEIAVDRVYDNTCVVTAVKFEKTKVTQVSTTIAGMADSFGAGERLAGLLPAEGLRAVLVFGTGVAINGSALVAGLQSKLDASVTISGGLAADAGAFKQTWTMGPTGSHDDEIVGIGLYGTDVNVSYGTFAGWEPFGPARKVTRCEQNILYELDGERALDIYKRYLGDYAKD
ncbi:MAG: hypothetical protein HYZ45_04105, partial [Burkholderiales bacterium]|nr:hypothetical protein [Burkholderiales bacterium]